MIETKRRPSYPHPKNPAVTAWARANVKLDTKPEMLIRSLLHRQGYRFRKNLLLETADLRVRPDIVFSRPRLAVFVDGCFWHCCPEHGRVPRSNAEYWRQKLNQNSRRDQLVNERLNEAGWTVLRIWEHVPPLEAVELIQDALGTDQQPSK